MQELSNNRLKSKSKINEVTKAYNITQKGTERVVEELKQRIIATRAKIKRYDESNKGYQQNQLFKTNQKRLYSQLRGKQVSV